MRIYGDKSDRGDFTDIFPDGGDRDPLIEYPDTFNKYDGDDIIDVGNANEDVRVWGQGGNDKIVGGYGDDQVDKLAGGSGDDKIWMINPNERHLDIEDDKNYGYGGVGNDQVYGSDAADQLWGDDFEENVLMGGDDFMRGYGGADIMYGQEGDDIMYGDEDTD